MRISYWSSDVCSSDLVDETRHFDEGTSGADRAENLRVCPGRIPPSMYVGQHDPGAYDVVKVKTSLSDGGRLDLKAAPSLPRSAERRGGKACASTCRSRWSPTHQKQKT